MAQGSDAELVPSVASAGAEFHSVQSRRNFLIRPPSRHSADHIHCVLICAPAVMTRPVLWNAEFRVTSPRPVDRQDDLAFGLVDVGNDLLYENADNPLLDPHIR
jgi:hypothetical protein